MNRPALLAAALVAASSLTACARHPGPPVAYEATTVSASFGRTWTATLDEFSRRTIPIKSIDRTSGVIITDALLLDPSYYPHSDCGSDGIGTTPFGATQGTFSVVVRGDSSQSTVRVNVRWISVGSGASALCSTKGTWERTFQSAVKDAAEGKAHAP
jgi:hypothetical protein